MFKWFGAGESVPPTDNRTALIDRLLETEELAIQRGDERGLRAVLAEADSHKLTPGEFNRYRAETYLELFEFRRRWTCEVTSTFEGRPAYAIFDTVRHKKTGEYGFLYLLDDAVVYVGEIRIEIGWAKVVHVHVGADDHGEVVAIQERGRRSATKFWFDRQAEALMFEHLVTHFRLNR